MVKAELSDFRFYEKQPRKKLIWASSKLCKATGKKAKTPINWCD
jgi:hypothetical protein